jgi:hypothetical protein
MPSQDYSFDPTASNPDNLILNEVHSLIGTVAVIPTEGAFYREGLVVEGIMEMGSTDIVESLRPDVDYHFSPIYIKPSAVSGKDAYSYILLKGSWDRVNITYQCVGGPTGADNDLLTKVASSIFDRESIVEWLSITGTDSYNPRSRNPLLAEVSELEIFNSGMERINETLAKLVPGGSDKATNVQVTNLEVRQTSLETAQSGITVEFDGIKHDFADIQELFAYLEDLVLRGKRYNIAENGGFVYHSDTPTTNHLITHGLNTEDVDVTVWVFDADTKTYKYSVLVSNTIVDVNSVNIVTNVDTDLLVVVRPITVADGGYIHTSTAPETIHVIDHNLNSGFISANVWVMNDNGNWEWALLPLRVINNNRVIVELTEAKDVKVVVQRPLPNAYIYKSPSAAQNHRITHDLYTPQVGVYIWERNDDGTYSTALPSSSMTASNIIDVQLDQPRIIKVVVQPALIQSPTFEQDYAQKHTLLEDRMDQIQNLFYSLEQLINDIGSSGNGGSLGNLSGIKYQSTIPALSHLVPHGLDDDMVDVVLWVEHDDGVFYNDDAKVAMVDDNTVRITLVEPANIRARITKM